MLKQTRRDFLKAAGVAGIGVSQILAGTNEENPPAKTSKKKLMSKIRVAQVKVYPKKGNLMANHASLMNILADIENNHDVDVVVTPEGFLDGYVSTEKSVTKGDMVKYAINPIASRYTQVVSDWAKRNKAWIFYGCTRKVPDGVYNTALIYKRSGGLVGMYDKLHIQTHDYKYMPGKHLNVYESDFGLFGVMICADRRWPETTRTLTLKGARVISCRHRLCRQQERDFYNFYPSGAVAYYRP